MTRDVRADRLSVRVAGGETPGNARSSHCHAVFFAAAEWSISIRAVSTRNCTALLSMAGIVNP
jgi:hypothetical protein